MADYHPYSSATPFFQGTAPVGLPALDINRLRSYDLYEQFYWNHPEAFRLLQRGEDQQPIYLPTAKKIVEAVLRYLAVDFDYVVEDVQVDPDTGEATGGGGTDGEKQVINDFFKQLFKRENFYSKFTSNKRFALIRGDAIWHITADDTKEEGKRISIHDVKPSTYFPIHLGELDPAVPTDPTKVIGCYLVDVVEDPEDDTKQLHRVQTYRKATEADELSGVLSKLELYDIGAWDARNLEPTDIKLNAVLVPEFALPPDITAIPVYHWKNTSDTTADFGSSLLRGIETVLAAINQSISDEDLALVMAGLGGYWTDAAPPVDEDGEPTAWELGPLRMTEVPMGRTVGRLQGVGSVAPSQDHINMLINEGSNIPDVAMGKVDVTVAESGISLALQLSPLLAANAEREIGIIGLHDQLFYDLLHMWMPAYEGVSSEAVVVSSIVGDPLPKPPKGIVSQEQVIALLAAKIITTEEARDLLIRELGVGLLSADSSAVLSEQKDLNADPFAARVNSELGGNDGTGTSPDGSAQGAPADTGAGQF